MQVHISLWERNRASRRFETFLEGPRQIPAGSSLVGSPHPRLNTRLTDDPPTSTKSPTLNGRNVRSMIPAAKFEDVPTVAYAANSLHTCATRKQTTTPMTTGNMVATVVHFRLRVSR